MYEQLHPWVRLYFLTFTFKSSGNQKQDRRNLSNFYNLIKKNLSSNINILRGPIAPSVIKTEEAFYLQQQKKEVYAPRYDRTYALEERDMPDFYKTAKAMRQEGDSCYQKYSMLRFLDFHGFYVLTCSNKTSVITRAEYIQFPGEIAQEILDLIFLKKLVIPPEVNISRINVKLSKDSPFESKVESFKLERGEFIDFGQSQLSTLEDVTLDKKEKFCILRIVNRKTAKVYNRFYLSSGHKKRSVFSGEDTGFLWVHIKRLNLSFV